MKVLENKIKKVIKDYDSKANSETSKYISASQEFNSMVRAGIACRRGHNTASVTKVTEARIKFNV